jgi:hypothetical protein
MRVDDRKRRPNEEDAALKLRYGELNPNSMVRVSRGIDQKYPCHSYWLRRLFPENFSPLDCFTNPTGIQREKVINIDRPRKKSRVFMER